MISINTSDSELTIIEIEKRENFIYDENTNSELPLPIWYSKVRQKKISELTTYDIIKFINQELYLNYIVPEALKVLMKNPTAGEKYYGQLLAALYNLEIAFWTKNHILAHQLLNFLNELNSGNLIPEDFDWTYEGEKQEFHELAKSLSEKICRLLPQE